VILSFQGGVNSGSNGKVNSKGMAASVSTGEPGRATEIRNQMSQTEQNPTKQDHLDRLHDLLAGDEAGAVLQAHVEGHLDAPLTAVIGVLGKGDGDSTRIAIVLNYVGRSLREAYGREAYEQGILSAQADVYAKGAEDVAGQFKDATTELHEAVEDLGEAVVTRLSQAKRHENTFAIAGGVGAMLGTSASFVSVLAMLWYTGGITFH
jgi:hypothetical protein